nr:MAG TPA: tail tube protein [Caudoviricetes sp.]
MEDSISWQTQALTGKLARDDSADHDWKWVVEDQATEEGAEEILKALLNVAAETEAQA